MPYLAVEKTVLAQFAFQNRDLIPEVEEVEKSKLAVLQAEVDEHKKKIDNLIRLAEATGDLDQVVNRIAELKGEIRKREEALQALKKPALTVSDGFQTGRWYKELKELEGDARVELRRKIQASIRRFLKRVEMNPERMLITLHFASGKVREFDVTPHKEKVGGNRVTRS
jgi:NAD-specific glutamate dehydrogenase